MSAEAERPREWELRLKGCLLGRIIMEGADQPWLYCRLHPMSAYEEVRPHFQAQAGHIEDEDFEALERVQVEIEALGLELRRVADGAQMDVSSLIIDGDAVEFCPIPLTTD